MNKHIFGLLIFGLIVAITWIGYAYFYAPPIPQIADINEYTIINAEPTRCFPRLKNHVSSEVESVGFLADENKLVSKIKLNWNGEFAAPTKIYVVTETFTSDSAKTNFRDSQVLINPFRSGNETEIIIESDVSNRVNFDRRQNYYAAFDISENNTDGAMISAAKKKTLAQPVVLVHGKSSIILK